MIKGSIQEDDVAVVNIYAPNIGAPQYIRQMLTVMKWEIDSNIIIVGDFNTPLISMDRSSRRKINKETPALNDTLDQLDLIDIYRTFHVKAEKYTFFSSSYGTFSRIDCILGHKSSLCKFKKVENHIKDLFQPQAYEIQNQLQKENCKECKHMEAKQNVVK